MWVVLVVSWSLMGSIQKLRVFLPLLCLVYDFFFHFFYHFLGRENERKKEGSEVPNLTLSRVCSMVEGWGVCEEGLWDQSKIEQGKKKKKGNK
jgi:hypothetical protein